MTLQMTNGFGALTKCIHYILICIHPKFHACTPICTIDPFWSPNSPDYKGTELCEHAINDLCFHLISQKITESLFKTFLIFNALAPLCLIRVQVTSSRDTCLLLQKKNILVVTFANHLTPSFISSFIDPQREISRSFKHISSICCVREFALSDPNFN